MTSRLTQMFQVPHFERPVSRRDMLCRSGAGFGAVALAGLLAENADPLQAAPRTDSPVSPKLPHHFVGAKSVIFLFMEGGPSQMDTFDPKPELTPGSRFPHRSSQSSRRWASTTRRCFHPNENGASTESPACGFPTGCLTQQPVPTTSLFCAAAGRMALTIPAASAR